MLSYDKFVSISIDEQENLEGHSLHASSLPVHDMTFPFDIRYQQEMVYPSTFLHCDYLLYLHRLTDQLALSPSMDSNYDYDLH